MSEIAENLKTLKEELGDEVELVAISKMHPVEKIRAAYDAGHRQFGENKAREMESKHAELPKDIEWHFVGHLQRNKTKYIAPFVHMIHSVDSLKLMREIDKQAAKHDRVVNVLLQVHIAREESKFGFKQDELFSFLDEGDWRDFDNVRTCGLMGMATLTEDEKVIHREFNKLRELFYRIKNLHFENDDSFRVRSMGMTSDYRIAVEEGSNMVRIGSAIFGPRNYD